MRLRPSAHSHGFTVVPRGLSLTYQWQKAEPHSGATAASFTTPAVQSGDNPHIICGGRDHSAGTVTSSSATLMSPPTCPGLWAWMSNVQDDVLRTAKRRLNHAPAPNVNSTSFGCYIT